MLILTRKQNQRILIDNGIVITVVEARHGRVKLGFDAPKEVQINREEIAAKRKGDSPCCTSSPT